MARKSQNNLFGLADRDLAHILRQGAADLELLRGKSVFVTGGTGFFGKWLLAGLCRAEAELGLGLRVTVLSRDPAAFRRQFPEVAQVPSLDFMRGDVTAITDDFRADYLIHGAADSSAVVDETVRSRVIVEGTRRMTGLARTSGARMLFVSSGAVYGATRNAREDDAVESLTAYGQAKREAERLCDEAVIARAFAFLGPWLPLEAHFAAGNFLRDAMRGGPILVRGDGTALRSYLHPAAHRLSTT